jgi:hypothetical protein
VVAAPAISLRNLASYASELIAAARRQDTRRLGLRRFALPFIALRLRFTSPALADVCERVLATTTAPAARTAVEIFAMDTEVGDGWPAPLPWDDASGFSSRVFDETLAAAGLRGFYHDRPSWQVYDPAARFGVQSLSAPLAFPPWESASPLRLFLHWAYASIGLRLTHAATLGVDGHGALIVGASGSGKSGTTLAGLLHGLDSVGDDYVVVAPHPELVAYRIFRTFKQDGGGLARVGIDLRDRALNWHGKVEFDPGEVSRPLADKLALCALLIPRIARAPRTLITPASAREAALALAPSGVLQLPGDSREGFRFFADLTRRLPAFHVSLSEDPREIAAAIGEFLGSRMRHAG